uniref:lipoprotein N-acyltransferase Lnb domain-containing protein n=1 Tax=Xanthomonas sp. 0924 TaxID=2835534 RepID=UPI003F7ED987
MNRWYRVTAAAPARGSIRRCAAACLLLLLAWLVAPAAMAQATGQALAQPNVQAPRVGVVTMQPGEVFFERFGHDAIVVVDPVTGQATSYNFGFFDPGEPDFVPRFARGEMMYYLVALPLEEDLQQYRAVGRGVSIQWLDLPPDQARALADGLAIRSQPENARYHYDYFVANCATMVRDTLDRAMGGALKSQLAGRSRGNTFRSEAVRLASPAPWMWLGFDLGLGPYADRPLSRWEEAFVPMRLADSLTQVHNSAGRPLVQSTQVLLPHRIAPEPAEQQRHWWPWLLTGLIVAAGVLALGRRQRVLAALALPYWLLCAIGGGLLVYLWGFTAHQSAWANRNLLLVNPLCVLLLIGGIAVLRGRRPGRWFDVLRWVVAAAALLALLIHWLSFQAQDNLQWVLLLLPIHAALAIALRRRDLSVRTR